MDLDLEVDPEDESFTGLAAPAAVVFLVMTGLPILVTPFVTAARRGEPAWAVMGPVGVITAVGAGVLVPRLRRR